MAGPVKPGLDFALHRGLQDIIGYTLDPNIEFTTGSSLQFSACCKLIKMFRFRYP